MAFDDGTPLDAAKLQSLETELFNLKASIPKIGSSSTNINVTENKTIVQKQILGNISSVVPLSRGVEVDFTITYEAESTPIAVILTPVKSSGDFKKGSLSYYVRGNTVTSTGASCRALLSKDATSNFSTRFYYMVICA